ncbi:Predicted PurR-regulated permease PerM [Methylobacterium sp. 174MFSha1.1]|uniref:AI-2E family transporter n=1 Tax=Methylobacterium sp. 174MFSha1.1 TaxID=1502749 RepID=UPI0008ECE92D|nr:AI-2E family transporter [Methylobacterium sp. 174MFSha1.1]SFV09778.1 Predicted PurR-regulated permease PerM [Methylobacterium sp. 174MFSha1.1]
MAVFPSQDAVPTRATGASTRSLVLAGIGVVSFTAILLLAWHSADTLLLIFAGILCAVFLDGLTHYLGRIVPLGHGARLAIVSVLLALLVLGMVGLGGATVAGQAQRLGETLQQQSGTVKSWLDARGIDTRFLDFGKLKDAAAQRDPNPAEDGRQKGPSGLPSPGTLLSGASSVLGQASTVALAVFGAIGNVFIVVVLGLFVAADPRTYRDGLLRFVPSRQRTHAASVADDIGITLRHWLFGQLVVMAAIFVCVWLGLSLVGIDGALVLGLQAGLLCFIPTIGALVAGIIIVLASLASGLQGVIAGMCVYLLVQTLESYVLTPFVQKRALDIPPATLFAGQILLGVLFGLWGVALALPLMAVCKVLLDRLYIEDTLGESAG